MTMVGVAGDSRPDEHDEHDEPAVVAGEPADTDRTDTDRTDDRALLGRLRGGDETAFGELFARHGAAVRGFALRYATRRADAEDLAAEAFFRVLLAIRHGHGPDDNMRGYLLTVVRRVAAEVKLHRHDVPTPDEALNRVPEPEVDRAASHAEANLIAHAFATLPQRWRSVLWQVEVQGARPAEVADRFGLSVNATAALARRARVGLRAAYLQAHVAAPTGPATCRTIVDKLGAYTAGSLRGRSARLVRGHLATCDSCRALHDELADVCAGLRRYAGQLGPAAIGAASLPSHGLLAHHLAGLAGKVAAFGARIKLAAAVASVAVIGGVGVAVLPLTIHSLPSDYADGPVLSVLPPTALSAPLLSTGGATTLVPDQSPPALSGPPTQSHSARATRPASAPAPAPHGGGVPAGNSAPAGPVHTQPGLPAFAWGGAPNVHAPAGHGGVAGGVADGVSTAARPGGGYQLHSGPVRPTAGRTAGQPAQPRGVSYSSCGQVASNGALIGITLLPGGTIGRVLGLPVG
ncbi:MAG TPA: sigma-70 family RNA polymerase sigma factor [Pseudonocardiaceae bacterium]